MMDTDKDIKAYQKEWFGKAEDVSTDLFSIAEDAIAADPNLNVIIVKRLPRFDRSSSDILGIKQKLSDFSNHVYDQLWLSRGSPDRIQIVELKLIQNAGYLKDIIYGNHEDAKYDGIHLNGKEASRHFSYRAVQAIYPVLYNQIIIRSGTKQKIVLRYQPAISDRTEGIITMTVVLKPRSCVSQLQIVLVKGQANYTLKF